MYGCLQAFMLAYPEPQSEDFEGSDAGSDS